jgi:hypothetical protein
VSGDRRGRPSKLTPQLADEIARHVRAGAYVETACIAAGIGRRTFYDWWRRGASDHPADAGYRAFRERVEQAQAEHQADALDRMSRTTEIEAEIDARAAMTSLAKRWPERWGPRRSAES